ncbi:MAG: cytidylate kinase-like family protein [Candidatus Eremiobacteraeota bacterium]|nr:cytidylate kinase-like family protein [Candidatus Eremiobacteraeota bacterium]
MIVSIARELGAGGRSVGEAIASAIGAALLDERSIIEELAQRSELPAEFVADHLERPPSRGERLIADLASASAMLFTMPWEQPDTVLIATVRDLVLEYAAKGHVVVIGHGGRSMLGWRPDAFDVLAILLRAGREWRIEQLARRYAIDRAEAQRRIERTDEARVRYQRHYFDSDLYDARQYDLVLCPQTLGLDVAIRLATDAARAHTALRAT